MQQINPHQERLDTLTDGYRGAQIVFEAVRVNLFEKLESPTHAEDVATATGWTARGARMLLDALVALDLIEKRDGTYRNLPAASDCLVPGAPHDQRHIILHRANCKLSWDLLGECLRTGAPARPRQGARNPEELRAFILGMADIAKISAQMVVEAVDLSHFRNLLDVAGGPATYTTTFLAAHPALRGTVFDLTEVIPISREAVAKSPVADRVSFIEGDLTRDPFGEGYDLVFASNIIHSLSAEQCRALMKKCFEALAPGGLLIVKDFLVDAERSGPPFSLLFALHMYVSTEAGDTYTFDEVAEWTDAAGFNPGRSVDLTPQTRLWLAEKPIR